MGLMCPLAVHLLQCRSSLCLHPENGLLRNSKKAKIAEHSNLKYSWNKRDWTLQNNRIMSLQEVNIHELANYEEEIMGWSSKLRS